MTRTPAWRPRAGGQLLGPGEADGVRYVAAIEGEVLVAGAAAGHAEYRIVFRRPCAGIDHHNAGRQCGKRGRRAIGQRQTGEHLAVHGLRDGWTIATR